jgi:hypothetical protein
MIMATVRIFGPLGFSVSGRHCERSEAIQLLSWCGQMDCFAALAMTL